MGVRGLAPAWGVDGSALTRHHRTVRTIKQLRRAEVDEQVAVYEADASVYKLAEQFEVHRATLGWLLQSKLAL